jgi:hypothetical protein
VIECATIIFDSVKHSDVQRIREQFELSELEAGGDAVRMHFSIEDFICDFSGVMDLEQRTE